MTTRGDVHRDTSRAQATPDSGRPGRPRVALRIGVAVTLMAVLLFGSAGRLDWPGAWIFLFLYTLSMFWVVPVMRRHAGLAEERTQAWKNAEPWDRWIVVLSGMVAPAATMIVAGFDVRLGWPGELGAAGLAAGVAALVAGLALGHWAVACNPFFSSVVRIQKDRGHVVATRGPYAYVRHPGYAGTILAAIGTAFLLGSVWALVPAVLGAAGVVIRTVCEERTLLEGLAGYREYANVVRFRLVPGVW